MKRMECDILIKDISQLLSIPSENAPVVNPERDSLGIIEDVSIVIKDGKIEDIGSFIGTVDAKTTIDAKGCIALPGFIDAHTHLIFGGSREKEFSMRISGKDYLAIMKEGGGIKSTVRATRSASADELFDGAMKCLDRALSWGTTTCEIKSGYGLTTKDEIKTLEVARMLDDAHVMDIVPTFLGAHEVPDEYNDNKSGYIELLLNEMIPEVSERGLARFCDVFCEENVFNKNESEKILTEGLRYGLSAKLHADEFSNSGGSEITEKVQAVSCDHLLYTEEKGLASMKKGGTVAVLLPGANLYLMKQKKPPVQKMREMKIPMAIASDFNPGSSPVLAMPVIVSLSCLLYGLTPEEAIVGATINGAHAIREGKTTGSLERGKNADVLIMSCENYEEIPYWFSQNRILCVIKNGKVVVDKREGGEEN